MFFFKYAAVVFIFINNIIVSMTHV